MSSSYQPHDLTWYPCLIGEVQTAKPGYWAEIEFEPAGLQTVRTGARIYVKPIDGLTEGTVVAEVTMNTFTGMNVDQPILVTRISGETVDDMLKNIIPGLIRLSHQKSLEYCKLSNQLTDYILSDEWRQYDAE